MKKLSTIAILLLCFFLLIGCSEPEISPEQNYIKISSEADFEKIYLNPIIEDKPAFTDENANNLNGDYILTKDIVVEHLIYIAKDATVTIDLNGHTIESKFEGFTIGNWGNLTLKDSSKDKTGIVCNTCTTFGNGDFGHDAVRNYGNLVIEGGTYGDMDLDRENENPNSFGSSLRNMENATALIKAGNFTTGDNYWTRPDGSNGFAYAINNYGEITVEDWYVYGKMNGGVAGNKGTVYLNSGKVEIANPNSWHTLTISENSGAKIYVSGGEYINNNTTYGHIFSLFNNMKSWEVTPNEENGYFLTYSNG